MSNFIVELKKQKATIIVGIVVWLLGIIFLIAPIAYTISHSYDNDAFSFAMFVEGFFDNLSSMSSIGKVFNSETILHFMRLSFIYTIILIVGFGVGMYKARSKGEYDKIEHGSSDWSMAGEQYKILSKNQGIILAEHNYLPLNKIGNINVLIVGGSGSGKSASYSIPNSHQLLGSYIFTDPKGEIYDTTAGFLKSQGYEIKILNLVNPKSSDSYNPLHHIQSEIDVDVIASTIVRGQKKENSTADPYWDNMSELLLKALIYYLIAKRPPEEQNLASCAELVRAANNSGDINMLSSLINDLPPDHPARMNYKSVELASDKTYSSILSSLQSSLGKFDSQEIADVTSTNTINFEDIASRKTALYVVSSDTHTAYDFLLTIFFSQMIQQLYDYADKNGGRLQTPTFFILDEFANIGQIPDFDKKISTSRSRGISFSIILQNLDQLKARYEQSYETIIGNCDTHVFLGSNSYTTVEYFSKELGEKTISHESKSVNRDKNDVRTGFSESDQILGRALMTPDELRRMPNDECIIFEKGLKPIKGKKFWWFKKGDIVRDFNTFRLNHNDYDTGNRGAWRKFDPNNPYESNDRGDEKGLEIGSLDDLFVDEDTNSGENIQPKPQEMMQNDFGNNTIENTINNVITNNNVGMAPNPVDKTSQQAQQKTNVSQTNLIQKNNQENNLKQNIMQPNVQQTNMRQELRQGANQQQVSNYDPNYNNRFNKNENEVDIQKELEQKFDELFGKIEN